MGKVFFCYDSHGEEIFHDIPTGAVTKYVKSRQIFHNIFMRKKSSEIQITPPGFRLFQV
jgi:hypothetical protein